MQSTNHPKLFEDVCEFYDILSVSKCGPYFNAPQDLMIDTRNDNPLHAHYSESYYPSKYSRLATGMATVITFFDFDENELEHQKILRLGLLKLQSVFSNLGMEIFYKSKLMSYHSPFFIASTKNEKYPLQQYLLNLYRKTISSLLSLDFTKQYFFEMDVDRKGDKIKDFFKQYGRFLFYVQDRFNDTLKQREIERRIEAVEETAEKHKFSEERTQRCKKDVLDPARYQGRRFIEITFLEKFHLDEEEFQKLKKIINDHEFSISAFDTRKKYPNNRTQELSLGELEELIVIK